MKRGLHPRRFRLYIASAGLLAAIIFLRTTHTRHAATVPVASDYRVEFASLPSAIEPGRPLPVEIGIQESASGTPITEVMAATGAVLILLTSQDLSYHQDLHAAYTGEGVFAATVVLPRPGVYQLYATFAPPNARPATARVSVSTADRPSPSPGLLPVTPYTKTTTKVFDGRYKVVLQWRGDATPSNSMGIELHYQVFGLPGQGDSPEQALTIAPQGPLVLISADSQTYYQASPQLLTRASGDLGSLQVTYVLDTFPPVGRYTLLGRLEHEGHPFLTDFTVDLP